MGVDSSNGLRIESNTFYAEYGQTHSSGTIIDHNTLSCTTWTCVGLISSTAGTGNRISNNEIDGGKSAAARGADDGIIEMPIENVTMDNVKIESQNPMRIGYTHGLKLIDVKIDAPKPYLVEQDVKAEGLPE